MTPTKRHKKRGTVTEMPATTTDNTPEAAKTPAQTTPDQSPETPFDDAKPQTRMLPAPRKFDLPPEEWFAYWIACEALCPGRLTAYVYRALPVCDVTQTLTPDELRAIGQKKQKMPPKNILKWLVPPITDPKDWNRWICEVKGAGDYHFKLTDNHPSVKKCISMSTSSGEGSLRQWDTYPPDLKTEDVVLTDPKNSAYLRWARLNGIKFPGDPGTPQSSASNGQENEEMTSVVDSVLKQNKELTDKVVEMTTERRTPVVNQPDATAKGQMGAVESVVEGAKQGMEIMGAAMKKTLESQARAGDPKEQLESILAVAKAIQPPPSDNSAVLKMMELQLTAQREQARTQLEQQEKNFTRVLDMQRESHQATMRILEERLKSLEERKAETPATREEASLDNFIRLKKKLRELDDEDDDGEENEGPAWLGPTLQFGEKIIAGITGSLNAFAAMKANAAPPAPVSVIDTAPPPAPQQSPRQPTPEEQRMNMMRKYAEQMHGPIINALKQGVSGSDFAAAVISEAGQGPYDFLANGGYQGVNSFLQSYPPLWQELITPPLGGAVLDKFIAEFLDKDAVAESMQRLKTGQPQAPPQRRGPTVNQ